MGWFLAHTSLAMTPEHSATNGENLSLLGIHSIHMQAGPGASRHAYVGDVCWSMPSAAFEKIEWSSNMHMLLQANCPFAAWRGPP